MGEGLPLDRPGRARGRQGRADHFLEAGRKGEAAADGVQEARGAGVQAVPGGVPLLEAEAQVLGLLCVCVCVCV